MTVCYELVEGSEYGLLSLQISKYFYVGVFRLFSFLVLFTLFYQYKRYTSRTGQLSKMKFFLILPIYYDYLRLLIIYSFAIGGMNLLPAKYNPLLNPYGIASQLGVFHFFYEGLWLFLTQYGAGRKAFVRATGFGLLSALISYSTFYIAAVEIKNDRDSYSFFYLCTYNVVMALLYVSTLVTRESFLYRRPAMKAYAICQAVYYIIWVFCVITVFNGTDVGYCFAASNYILFDGILKPAVIFYTLSMDSAYWQGIGTAGSSLLKNLDVDMDIATTMSKVDSSSGSVPSIHFGLIELEKDMGFVAGGFSRVYFGKYNNSAIALKMLYVMELTPQTVAEFCQEAKLLTLLKHDNVIQCRGVCVMPPAISIVLEFCKYGSLFDVLYKARNTKKNFFAQGLKIIFGQEFSRGDSMSEVRSPFSTDGDDHRRSFVDKKSVSDRRSFTERKSLTEMPPRSSSESSQSLNERIDPKGGTNRNSYTKGSSNHSNTIGRPREKSLAQSTSLNDPKKILFAHSHAKVCFFLIY